MNHNSTNDTYDFRLHKELAGVKENWDLQITEISRGTVSRDIEFEAVKESNEKLKAELVQRKEDIERYGIQSLF